ncbi:GNAT family N-acetyltransferase [Phytohabitans sp. ZYX-F-186]|uniref:GNAT family N-acetyltransferase n=1 Tax=Phytohabitans maris TaxID=3071409 RepID=A0ABU0ZEU5_9ACTN|nr:GNAT family N-acetyltransferase [Phytohabitans sp. ZYX-F-186]MDQ7905583.1 GNAT family N-acetyltransferase [Phytohabitans sp. ZYX-F-186]
MTDDLPLRPATPDDFLKASTLLFGLFHRALDQEEQDLDRRVWEADRTLVVTDADEVVGHTFAAARDLTVPGAVLPAAHVTGVGVAPTHRRRGLLTRLMRRQLRDLRDAGREPLAILWASEARIYPRFGYGLASTRLELSIDTREVKLPAATAGGRLRAGSPADLYPELTKVYDTLRPERPGWSSRTDEWWAQVLADSPGRREGATERRAVVHEGEGGVDGYALWRSKSGWSSTGPNATVHVSEIAAADPVAYATLWRFLLGIDLARTVTYGFAAVDDPLLYLASDIRQLDTHFADGLWVRLLDLPAALAARRYATDLDVVFEVGDPLLPENAGRWRVAGGPPGATCERTSAEADLACDVTDLGAAYLGGTSLAALAAAGRVRELRPGALHRASTAFGWYRQPSAPEIF